MRNGISNPEKLVKKCVAFNSSFFPSLQRLFVNSMINWLFLLWSSSRESPHGQIAIEDRIKQSQHNTKHMHGEKSRKRNRSSNNSKWYFSSPLAVVLYFMKLLSQFSLFYRFFRQSIVCIIGCLVISFAHFSRFKIIKSGLRGPARKIRVCAIATYLCALLNLNFLFDFQGGQFYWNY